MPSIFGSDDSSISDVVFKKLLIFFLKSNMSSLSKALPRESIDLECFIFSNLFEGLEPIKPSRFSIFFRNGYFLTS